MVGHRGPMNMDMDTDTHVYDGYTRALIADDMCAWMYKVDFMWDLFHLDMCNKLG